MLKNSENNKYLLSILIPAYNYPIGVERILSKLSSEYSEDIEIIVFDDSSDNKVHSVCTAYKDAFYSFIYKHNDPAMGAVVNWNSLLDEAQGEYCLLLHHDEFPLGDNFVNKVIDTLSINTAIDVLIMDLVLVDINTGFIRQHAPSWLRNLSAKYFPEYLFRRNVIGPISTLIIRRKIFPHFDSNLQWMVDVDLYVRLFLKKPKIKFNPSIRIGSSLDRTKSITSSISHNLDKIEKVELHYLNKIYGPKFSLYRGGIISFYYMPLYIFEKIFWIGFRVIQYLPHYMVYFIKKFKKMDKE
jgi:glycosyltransferase involved in cell wall biosynthesis